MASFSSLDRLVACSPSEAYPHTPEAPNDDAREGTSRHEFLRATTDGEPNPLAQVPAEHRDMCLELQTDGLPFLARPYRAEIAVTLNLDTLEVRILGYNIHRAYPNLGPAWICGTVDCWVLEDGVVIVVDHKGSHDTSQEPAATSLQLRIAGLCGCILSGASSAQLSHCHWRDDGTPWIDGPHVVPVIDLIDDARRVSAALAQADQARALLARGVEVPVRTGRWCRYCPAVMACPETRRVWGALTVAGPTCPAQSDLMAKIRKDPAAAREATKLAKHRIAEIEGHIAVYAHEVGGFDVGGGKRYGPHPAERKEIDGGIAFSVTMEAHGLTAALAAVRMATSEAALKRGAKAVGLKQAPTARALIAEITARGGITVKQTTRCEEYRTDGVVIDVGEDEQ